MNFRSIKGYLLFQLGMKPEPGYSLNTSSSFRRIRSVSVVGSKFVLIFTFQNVVLGNNQILYFFSNIVQTLSISKTIKTVTVFSRMTRQPTRVEKEQSTSSHFQISATSVESTLDWQRDRKTP